MPPAAPFKLSFQHGTLVLTGEQPLPDVLTPFCVYDPRLPGWRAEAANYATIYTLLYREKLPCIDEARNYATITLALSDARQPRYYQQEALDAWMGQRRRGIAVLPTGTGKSFLAMMAMVKCQRSTLVVAPTIDLMEQWASQLQRAFGCQVGMLGGGNRDVCDVTVSTYDSAVLMMEFIGNRFGLLIVDECHHLPGPVYCQLSRM